MNAEKLLKTIEDVRVPAHYGMTGGEMMAIYESSGDVVNRMIKAFNYGFLKGQRAAARKNGSQLSERSE